MAEENTAINQVSDEIVKTENEIIKSIRKFWQFLKKDTWQSWLVSLILIVILIRFVFFPLLSLGTGTSLPLVVVDSCSMYHSSDFNSWWNENGQWYESRGINKTEFQHFDLGNGFSKGDIIFVLGEKTPKIGDIIIFAPNQGSIAAHPIIHRIVTISPIGTKGDNNQVQLVPLNNPEYIDETSINKNQIVGKAVFRIPYIGWVKLIFFEFSRQPQDRGLCK